MIDGVSTIRNKLNMDSLREAFRRKVQSWSSDSARILHILQETPVLVTFVTAGFPRNEDTVPILLAMQAGGTDIIELGVPFSDPIADGPVIQETNTV